MEEKTYLLSYNQESEMELTRLIEQSRVVSLAVGDLLPPSLDPSTLHRVLDIGCGPGDWCVEVAEMFPSCEVLGIDSSRKMVEYAKAQAQSRNVTNVQFQVTHALHTPYDFPAQSFDLINSRFSASFIT